MYHVFIVGFQCKGCLLERESMKTQATEDWRDFAGSSRLSILRKEACALHITRMRKSWQMDTTVSYEYLAGKAFPRDTLKTFCSASLSSLIHTFCAYTIYIYITHKCEESFWEKILAKTLES